MNKEKNLAISLILFGAILLLVPKGELTHREDGMSEGPLLIVQIQAAGIICLCSGCTILTRKLNRMQIGYILLIVGFLLILTVFNDVSAPFVNRSPVIPMPERFLSGYEILGPIHAIYIQIIGVGIIACGFTLIVAEKFSNTI